MHGLEYRAIPLTRQVPALRHIKGWLDDSRQTRWAALRRVYRLKAQTPRREKPLLHAEVAPPSLQPIRCIGAGMRDDPPVKGCPRDLQDLCVGLQITKILMITRGQRNKLIEVTSTLIQCKALLHLLT